MLYSGQRIEGGSGVSDFILEEVFFDLSPDACEVAASEREVEFEMADSTTVVVLAHFDAEELGLVGSQVFVDDPPIPLDSVALIVNLDMIGRLRGG